MNLNEVDLNKTCIIKEIKIANETMKLRIMELGLINNTKILVKHKSLLKKTLLIIFNASCFSIKNSIAKDLVVEYV